VKAVAPQAPEAAAAINARLREWETSAAHMSQRSAKTYRSMPPKKTGSLT